VGLYNFKVEIDGNKLNLIDIRRLRPESTVGLNMMTNAKDMFAKRKVLFLVSNGAIPATVNQALYELAWNEGIRPIDEKRLKQGYAKRGNN